MAKYQSPGIYTEEIPNQAQEIVRGKTVAVFIGYSEKHENESGETLQNIPTTVNSILEFEAFFGKAQPEENIEIIVTSVDDLENIAVQFNGNQSSHNLYYSLVSYFENGGNSCKIVSVGVFKNIGETLSATELITGLHSLKEEKDSLLICIPEDQNLEEEDFYLLQKEILDFCKMYRGFSLLNLPANRKENFRSVVEDYREKTYFDYDTHSYGSVFMPNLTTKISYSFDETLIKIKKIEGDVFLYSLKTTDEIQYLHYLSLIQQFKVTIPPTGAVSGAMIYSENTRGIWKAPANISLNGVLQPAFNITDREKDSLNLDASGKSINCIRTFAGKGVVIWGSRTLNGNNHEWRYIPIRRLVSKIEKDIEKTLETFIFEPNIEQTWMKLKNLIENHLQKYWREGAFFGAKPEEAFFVKCDHQTMTDQDILQGKLILQIGISPIRPAEFIILQFQQKMLTP